MRPVFIYSLTLATALLLAGCGRSDKDTFWIGADISQANGMNVRGEKLKAYEGDETYELTALMAKLGCNAARYRVWVDPLSNRRSFGNPQDQPADPHAGSCDKEDLLANCLLAKQNGLEIMVDFHYSDSWADPGKQPIPHQWSGHSYEQMRRDLADHTTEVLQYLKDNGIEPRWIQIGNETSNGLLWTPNRRPRGAAPDPDAPRYSEHMGNATLEPDQYAGFIQAGEAAAKKVFPKAVTIVHLDNGYNPGLYDWNLGILEENGVHYDMVGMSLYPYWAAQSGHDDADQVIDDCIANIKHVYERFGKESMIVETGFEVNMDHPEIMEEGYRQLTKIISLSLTQTDGHCHGVFYWEPEARPRPGQATAGYKLGAFGSDDRPTKIFRAFTEAAGMKL